MSDDYDYDEYGNNPYSAPSKFGLTIVGEAQDPEASYSFDMVVVWRDAAGKLYWATDSGCSCPGWFENYTTLESLSTGTEDEAIKGVLDWAERFNQEWRYKSHYEEAKAEAHTLIRKIREIGA